MQQGGSAAAASLRVFRQQRHPREGFTARRTRILLYIRMRLQMSPQIRSIRKRPIAVITRERFFARVGAYVTLEEPWTRKRLPTHRTLAGQRVRPNMHLQSAEGHVHFLAVLATELLPGALSSGAVELSVFRQSREGGVTFTAIWALMAYSLSPLLGEVFRVYPRRRRSRRRIRTQRGLVYGGIRRRSQRERHQRLLHLRVHVRWR